MKVKLIEHQKGTILGVHINDIRDQERGFETAMCKSEKSSSIHDTSLSQSSASSRMLINQFLSIERYMNKILHLINILCRKMGTGKLADVDQKSK